MFDRTAVTKYRDDIARDLAELIRIPSVQGAPAAAAPFGKETAAALDFVLERGQKLGFKTKNLDGYAGHVEYGTTGPLYGVLAHLDVVPAGVGWKHEPFGGEIEDSRIYGRGAADNKGPAIVALYVLRAFADEAPTPNCRIRLIFGTNEESGMGGIKHYFKHEELPVFGFSPDSGYPLYNREMGIVNAYIEAPRTGIRIVESGSGGKALNMVADEACATIGAEWEQRLFDIVKDLNNDGSVEHRIDATRDSDDLVLTARGISAHGGRPANGVSAIAYMVHVIAELALDLSNAGSTDSTANQSIEPEILGLFRLMGFETRGDSLGIACRDNESGELSVNWGTIEINDDNVKSGLNIRYPVTADFDRITRALAHRASRYGFSTSFEHHLEPLFISEDDPYIKTLLGAYATVTGESASPLSMSGGTYARMLKNRGVAFGAGFPGDMNNVHQPDEHVSLDSLMRHAEISLQALYELSQL